MTTYYVFISHAWRYHDDYDRIEKLLNNAPRFLWRNFSVPKHDPAIANNVSALKKELDDQIRPTQAVLILSGLYVSHSNWIEYEINKAVAWGKWIVGVTPWGNQNVPKLVRDYADTIVGWNTSSIVEAIRQSAR